jgi:hypothetical protein
MHWTDGSCGCQVMQGSEAQQQRGFFCDSHCHTSLTLPIASAFQALSALSLLRRSLSATFGMMWPAGPAWWALSSAWRRFHAAMQPPHPPPERNARAAVEPACSGCCCSRNQCNVWFDFVAFTIACCSLSLPLSFLLCSASSALPYNMNRSNY